MDQAIADLSQKDAEIEGAVLLVAGTVPSVAGGAEPPLPPGYDPAAMGEQLRAIATQMSGVGGSIETLSERTNAVEAVANSHD